MQALLQPLTLLSARRHTQVLVGAKTVVDDRKQVQLSKCGFSSVEAATAIHLTCTMRSMASSATALPRTLTTFPMRASK